MSWCLVVAEVVPQPTSVSKSLLETNSILTHAIVFIRMPGRRKSLAKFMGRSRRPSPAPNQFSFRRYQEGIDVGESANSDRPDSAG